MPMWLIQILVSLALKFGIPWILTKFPWIPQDVVKVIEDLIQKLEQHQNQKQALMNTAKTQIAACMGPTCTMEDK